MRAYTQTACAVCTLILSMTKNATASGHCYGQQTSDVCLPQLILDIADKVMQKQCDRASLWVLDASNESRVSQHIIVGVHPHGYLGNVQQVVGSVVKNVCDIAQHMDEFCALDGHHNKHCIIDTSVYSKNQQFRVMFSSKFEQQRPLVPINKLSAVSLLEN